MDLRTEQKVAIKQLKAPGKTSEQRASVNREIDLLKRLRHRNIVKYIDSVEDGGSLNIVMEFVDQGSLDKLL